MEQSSLPPYLRQCAPPALAEQACALQVAIACGASGTPRRIYQLGAGHKSKIVLLPPYGMSVLLMIRLAALLAEHYHVLAWESVGCPDSSYPAEPEDFQIAYQLRDLKTILERLSIDRFHFVGWCQAAQLVVYSIVNAGVRPATMSWIAPAGLGQALVKSEFDRCALPIYLEIERRGLSRAEAFRTILDKYRDVPFGESINGERLTMLHLSSCEATLVFSKYMKCYEDGRGMPLPLLERAMEGIPTQIVHCRDDAYSHFSEAVQIAKKIPSAQLHLLDRGGHLQLFDAPEAPAELILRFIASHDGDIGNSSLFAMKG